jgi:drug/metabolite transporter (DMT)-like permease
MIWLVVVSLVWAFSFGLIKRHLVGVDPTLVAFVRVALSLIVLAPFFRRRGLGGRDALVLGVIGAVQFGLMYVAYTAAYAHLPAYTVALWTIFTPLFVCLIDDLLERRVRLWPVAAAVLATLGAGLVWTPAGEAWRGIVLVQVSNAAFAFGQVAYRRWRRARPEARDAEVFALLYLGAAVVTLPGAWPKLGSLAALSGAQALTLIYLGVVASGLGFFLWNFGAARTHAGGLAVANNLKIPLGVACSLLVFGEKADLLRLTAGGAIVAAALALATWAPRRDQPKE